MLVVIIVLMIVISLFNSVFFRLDNLMDILKNASVLGILSCGMLLVVLTGGIDVSVAAITAACTCVCGVFIRDVVNSIPLTIVVCILFGLTLGLGNGLLISRLKIPPIVATLGTASIIYGLVKYITNGSWITGIPDSFAVDFGQISFFAVNVEGLNRPIGLPVQVIFLIIAIAVTWWLLKYTRFGRSVFAIGGNRESAQRIGYNVRKSEPLIYMYLGGLAGFASVAYVSIMRQVDPNSFVGYELMVIAATVIGGVSINGGYGSVMGAMLGVFLMTILQNGLILMRIPTFWQQIVTGLIIIVVVSFDMYSSYLREKNRRKVDVSNTA